MVNSTKQRTSRGERLGSRAKLYKQKASRERNPGKGVKMNEMQKQGYYRIKALGTICIQNLPETDFEDRQFQTAMYDGSVMIHGVRKPFTVRLRRINGQVQYFWYGTPERLPRWVDTEITQDY
jgi:hypothetical protein